MEVEIRKFPVTLTLTEPLLGTVPKNKDVYAIFIATKSKSPVDADEEVGTVEEAEGKGWTGFHRDDDGFFLYDYQIKGFLKEAGNTLKNALDIKGLRAKIEKFVFVMPRRIRLPEIMAEPLERPLRAMTPKGERVTVTRSDQIAPGAKIEFELWLVPGSEIGETTLKGVLDYGALKGLGQWRGGSYGRFSYEMRKA